MGLQVYDGTQWTGVGGGGGESYSVYGENTSAVTVTKTATVDIPAGTYAVSQLSTEPDSTSLFDSNTVTSTESKAYKFTGSVTSVGLTLKPGIVIASSLNTWKSRTSGFGTSAIEALTFANNTFVAAGRAGKLSTSTDGTTWTSKTSGFDTDTIQALTFGDNIYVAGGNNGKISTSTDIPAKSTIATIFTKLDAVEAS
jgi:hypothetical protein